MVHTGQPTGHAIAGLLLAAATSHAGMSPQDRERLGITADLVRISSGIEGTQDLIDDFARALDKVTGPSAVTASRSERD